MDPDMTPPYRVFIGEVYNRSAPEGDPQEVTFSFFGVLIWDGRTPYQADNLVAGNPRSRSVINRSPENGDPAILWLDRSNRLFLQLVTNSLDFADCPGEGGGGGGAGQEEEEGPGGEEGEGDEGGGLPGIGGTPSGTTGGGVVTR